MKVWVGVDGGGTRTRALVVDADGTPRGRAEGAAALANARQPEVAAGAVRDVVVAALAAADVSGPAEAVWAGLAGAGREAARAAVELEVSRTGVAKVARVGTDVAAAFHDAFGDGPGILLIAGTGSIAWGRTEDGGEARVGGWGHVLGDEGSGYAVGLSALRRVVRAVDGRDDPTQLVDAVLEELGLESPGALIQWAADADKAKVAALAPLVASTADDGDETARAVLDGAAEDLLHHVSALWHGLDPWPEDGPSVALAGGLLRPGRALRSRVEARLAREGLAIQGGEPDAARGAAALARTIPPLDETPLPEGLLGW